MFDSTLINTYNYLLNIIDWMILSYELVIIDIKKKKRIDFKYPFNYFLITTEINV